MLGGAALIATLSASSGAQAQCTNSNFNFGAIVVTPKGSRNLVPTASPLVSITNTVNTAFLTNTTSFVSAPPGAQPDQQSGGVWARAIGGYVDSKSNSTSTVDFIFPPIFVGGSPFPATGTQTCHQSNHQDYEGSQVGGDIAKLNIGSSGANLHFGVTGGFFGAKAEDTTPAGGSYNTPGDLKSRFDVPFAGVYTAFTQGNFFADAQVRWDFYQNSSSSEIQEFRGVENEARGVSVTGGAGYRIPLASNWFIEPSVGASWSRVKVDPVTLLDCLRIWRDCARG